MKLETMILSAAVVISIASIFFVPKEFRFKAQFIFLFVQFPTWLLGLCTVEFHLLEYPYRELSKVNRTSFIFEYLVLPVLSIHFNARFPQNTTKKKKFAYYFGAVSIITAVETILERFTDVIKYIEWRWYMTFIGIWLTFWLSRKMLLWFFNK